MLTAVKERQELDRAMLRPSAELQAYLESPLQLTDDVGWWGVCFGFLIQFNYLLMGCIGTSNSVSDSFADGLRLPRHPRIGYTLAAGIL
jgi:hypothetical protein